LTKIWEEDIDVFFDESDFADPCTYVDPSGGSHSIKIIFEREKMDVSIGGTTFESVGPTALIRSANCPGINNKATLTIDIIVYHVTEVHPSTTGITMVNLSRDSAS